MQPPYMHEALRHRVVLVSFVSRTIRVEYVFKESESEPSG
jgi:hypothetical protein